MSMIHTNTLQLLLQATGPINWMGLAPLQKPKDSQDLTKVKAQLEEQLKIQRAAAAAQKAAGSVYVVILLFATLEGLP